MVTANYRGASLFYGWGSDSYRESSGYIPVGPGAAATINTSIPVLIHLPSDTDHDGLADWREFLYGTDPTNPDTNGDGIWDGVAVAAGLDPLAPPPALPPPDPNDHTPPVITITFPTVGVTPL